MPVLARFERELGDEPFAVIGVHSPKFPNERDPEMVRQAVRRYAIHHPVVVDSGFAIWQSFGIEAWPTLVLIDPEGYVVGYQPGEPPAEPFLEAIRRVLEEHRARGTLEERALPISLPEPEPGALAYPGKLLRDEPGDRLFISDTGNGQVVELTAPATPGARERRFTGFEHPHGLALADRTLYAAETGGHAIAAIDLESGHIERVAGTGTKGQPTTSGGRATEVALRSPWDLAWDPDRRTLYVAMAGSHQLWAYSPATGTIEVLAGSGREARVDGANFMAAFAQPSGIALVDGTLYVADSEISCVRAVRDLDGRREVTTICGGDLFDFGDRDGVGDEVRFQHPIGIAAEAEATLLVADTYNHKIKRVEPATGRCTTLYGNGQAWRHPEQTTLPEIASDQVPLFQEPEGVAVDRQAVWIADTNDHRVLRIERGSGRLAVAYGR